MKLPALRNADAHMRLSIYLNDHLGGATAGVNLARRLADHNKGTEYGPALERIAREIEEDVASLREVMARFGVDEDRVKQAGALVVERIGRLKLNGQLTGYSPLSRLVELEGLMLGVTGKRALWLSLFGSYRADPRLKGVDLSGLQERANSQRAELERMRRNAAREALT